MSALPEDPGHFVAWRARQHPELMTEPGVFAPRVDWGRYLDETVPRPSRMTSPVGLRHLRVRATGIRRDDSGVVVTADDGQVVVGDAVVLATGEKPPGFAWAPESLQRSAFFVPDPWAPGAIDVVRRDAVGPPEVLLVGTGLTMVDVVLSLTGPSQRPDRRLHAVSRHGELPKRHADELQLAAIPEIDDWGDSLEDYRTPRGRAHRRRPARRPATGVRRSTGCGPSCRRCGSGSTSTTARRSCATTPAPGDALRHRMPPGSADVIAALESSGTLTRSSGEVAAAEPLTGGGLRVTLDRRQRPRRRLGGQLHRHQHRRAPGRRPAGRTTC